MAGEMGFNVERDHKGRTSIDFVVRVRDFEAEYDEGEAA